MKTLRKTLTVNTIVASGAFFGIAAAGCYFALSSIGRYATGSDFGNMLTGTFRAVDRYELERYREFDAFAETLGGASYVKNGSCSLSGQVATLDVPYSDPAWGRFVVVDAKGDVCASSDGTSALSKEEKDILRESRGGTRAESDFVPAGGSLGDAGQIVAASLPSASGTISGALVARLRSSGIVRILSDFDVPLRLYSGSGLVVAENGTSVKKNDADGPVPGAAALWNFASNMSGGQHATLDFGGSSFIVVYADETGIEGYAGKGWRLIGAVRYVPPYGPSFALLGAALFGLLATLIGFTFYGRIALRLASYLHKMGEYAKEQLRGVTVFFPKDEEEDVRFAYAAIERLAMRYHVLARTRDEGAIKLSKEMEAFRAERDRYAVMIGAMREGACALDNDGVITLCNLAAATIIGKDRNDIVGKRYDEVIRLYLDEDLTKEFDALAKALISGGLFSEEGPYYLRQPGGGGLPIRLQSTVIRTGQDRAAVGIFVLMRDVAKELSVEQSKNEFISVTSHQMRTPLATMRWHIERLLRPGAPPPEKTVREYLERIERNNRRMIKLADALLDVSRIDLDVTKQKDAEIDVPTVVREVLDEIDETTLGSRKIVQDFEGTVGQRVFCDPYLVRVVFENFIENAIAYTKTGGKIEVRAAVEGDSLRIDVTDDGIGIAPEMKPQIFSKFVRGKDATSMSPEGTGLGLYITKSLVERAGGKIWFESRRNEGTTFSVRIPLGEPKT